jgi:hypothetical protein
MARETGPDLPQQDDSHSNPFLKFAPPGDFYSPIPDPAEVARYRATLFDRLVSNVPGVDIRADEQVALLQTFGSYYRDIPFKDEPTRGYAITSPIRSSPTVTPSSSIRCCVTVPREES